jgi:hypothetical protein
MQTRQTDAKYAELCTAAQADAEWRQSDPTLPGVYSPPATTKIKTNPPIGGFVFLNQQLAIGCTSATVILALQR